MDPQVNAEHIPVVKQTWEKVKPVSEVVAVYGVIAKIMQGKA